MSFWDKLTGKDAADTSRAAAADTYDKQQKAIRNITDYGDSHLGQFRKLAGGFDPYVNAGSGALSMLMGGLGLNGGQGSADFTAAYRGLPGYQSGLQTGQDAALAAANAGGRLNSGAAQKQLLRYGSDYEDQRSGDYLNRLMGLSGMGQQAVGQQVSTVGQGLQGQLGTRQSAFQGDMNAAGTIGQGMVAGAQAEQQGMTNIMGTLGYLGGQALGGGFGTSLFKGASGGAPGSFTWGGQQYPMYR